MQRIQVLRKQRDALSNIFASMEEYFAADIDAQLARLTSPEEEEPEIDAEFDSSNDDPNGAPDVD
jgi:hypothetical protein